MNAGVDRGPKFFEKLDKSLKTSREMSDTSA
jgi:hypothetical protein